MSFKHTALEEEPGPPPSGRSCEVAPPPCGSEIRIRSSRLRLVGRAGFNLILAHSTPPYGLYLVADRDGCPSLMTCSQWSELALVGEAEVLPAMRSCQAPDPTLKLLTQVELLDAAGVKNGAKAIAIWLHRHWTGDLLATWGPHDNVHTIRKWRAGDRARRGGAAPQS
ncbi:hypothetical protein [Sphingomonas sp. S2-65]|uniref:hypothetical protein n=1 Tax=Sphingomonas sp. S2-65 TaxID=2903960 RepID=UPI001F3BB060|nr:hypothetical protein [Sphingomonas sp. S2-65]UYY58003.1 hypothetical protein LZ586_15265 [Sphingomonas sp. S2-65]